MARWRSPLPAQKAAVQAGAFAADHVIGMKIPERDGPEKLAAQRSGASDQIRELLTSIIKPALQPVDGETPR
jgi:hypothetical protein